MKKGSHQSKESREKISKVNCIIMRTPEVQIKIRKPHPSICGNNNPAKRPEVRAKISQSKMGDKNPMKWPENKAKISGDLSPTKRPEVRAKISAANSQRRGKDASNWRGGLSFLPYCEKWTSELKNKIRERDNYQCQHPNCLCTQLESLVLYNRILMIHHIHYDKPNCEPDLITLCNQHHSKSNGNRRHHEELYMKILEERNLLNYFGDKII